MTVGIFVTYFETSRGDKPVQDYVESLPVKERAKVKGMIDFLSEKVVLNEPYAKKMVGYPGLYELRSAAHRIFYCYHESKIVLLHAFCKKSNQTPRREIETAYARMQS